MIVDEAEEETKEKCNRHCVTKYFLFTINALVWVVSIILVGVGSWAHSEKDKYDTQGSLSFNPAIIIIVTGIFLFLVTFCGCVGAIRENKLLLRIYMVVLVVLFTLEIIAGFTAFFFIDQTRTKIAKAVRHFVIHYQDDPDLQNAIDGIQMGLKCCGGYSYHDWDHNKYFNCSSPSVLACGVPYSCCTKDKIVESRCGFGIRRHKTESEATGYIYTKGCIDSLSDWMMNNFHTIGGIAFGLAIIQLLAILGSMNLIADIEQAIATNDKLYADPHLTPQAVYRI